MPRFYVRKNADYGNTPERVMQEAVDAVASGTSVRAACRQYGIPRSTLTRNIEKAKQGKQLCPNYKHSQIFSTILEDELETYLSTCAKMFHGLTTKSVRCLAYEMAIANNSKHPLQWDETKSAGKEWLLGFMRRHPNLSIRQPEATSLARATAFNRHTIGAFFTLLEDTYLELSVTGAQIFNLDETGITTAHKVPKVVAPRGAKQLGQITSRERGELVTMCCIVSAAGQSLPPVFVFPRKNFKDHMLFGAPEGSLGLIHQSGWMTAENFIKVITHIIKHTRPTQEHPIILTMDNHESHLSYNALELAKNNHIHIITLPPHTSNKTQPLDRSIFGPMKTHFNRLSDSWMLQNVGKTISIYQLAQLGGTAFVRAATPENICSGFRASGIWPLNPEAFDNIDYLPSSITDRPNPEQQTCPASATTSLTDLSAPQPSSPPEVEPIAGPSSVSPELAEREAESSISTASKSIEGSSSKSKDPVHTSPFDLRGYPKVSGALYI